jgi:hypothetical protein
MTSLASPVPFESAQPSPSPVQTWPAQMRPRSRRRPILACCTRKRYAGAVRGVASLLDSAQPPPSYPRVRAPVYAPSKEGNRAIANRRRARQPPGRRAELAGRKRGRGAQSGCGGWSRRGVERDAVGGDETRDEPVGARRRSATPRGAFCEHGESRGSDVRVGGPKLRGVPPAFSCVLAGASCVSSGLATGIGAGSCSTVPRARPSA